MDVGYITRKMANDKNATKIAIQEESGRSWSYHELHRKSNAYAHKLSELGVQKGDRVGILLYNCLEYFGLYFAVAKLGAIAVRLNFRLSSSEFEYALNDSGTKILCFDSDLIPQLEGVVNTVSVEQFICLHNNNDNLPAWSVGWELLEAGNSKEVTNANITLDDPVMLMYTSGTTGRPKGAIWTHGTTIWFASIQVMKWKFTGDEVGLLTGPLYHVAAMEDIGIPILMMGGTVIIAKSKGFQIERILSVVENEKVTDCFLFPFMIYDMLNSPKLDQYKLEHLKVIYTGGDPITPWGLEQLKHNFPHIGMVQVYGLTEGTPIAASLNPEDVFTKGHTVGKPMPLTEIKIVDDAGLPLSVGEVGEIAISGPAVSAGYWNKPNETSATFIDGWCRTGDLGVFDEDGYLTIAGRKKDMIRSGGENIYAAEIENVLIRHEKVKEVSIIGIPDPQYVESVCAVIVTKQGASLSEQEVINYCKQHLASYKKPKKVIFVEKLPRTPSGKVQKYVLRNRYREKCD